MKKEIYGYVNDLPKGCMLETDLYTDTGAFLCPMMTVIDEKIMQSLLAYKGMIHATISYGNRSEQKTADIPEPDNSVCFDNSFKKYAVESLTTLYSNIED